MCVNNCNNNCTCNQTTNPCGCKTSTDDIVYNGPNLECTGIETCDTLTTSLQTISEYLCSVELVQVIINNIVNNVNLYNQFTTIVNNTVDCQTVWDCINNTTTTTTTASAPINPNDIAGLWAWYKGEVGVEGTTQVTAWQDQSLSNNDLITESIYYPEAVSDIVGTLNTTVIKKVNYSTLANMRTIANFSNISSTGCTVFIVAKVLSSPGSLNYVFKTSDLEMYINNTPTINSKLGVNTPTTLSSPITLDNYYTFRMGGYLNNQYLSVNNSTPETSADAAYFFLNRPFRIFAQGGPYPTPSEQGDLAFAEIIVYNEVLSPSQVEGVENYLRNKYNHY